MPNSIEDLARDLADRRRRSAAVAALKRCGPEAGPAVSGALRDPDPAVRAAAVGILAVIGGDLLPQLRDLDASVRDAAARAIATQRLPVAALMPGLEDPRPEVRAATAAALAGRDDAVSALARATSDPEAHVRAAAIRALAGRAPDATIRALGDRDAAVRTLACNALRAPGLVTTALVPPLIAALSDPDEGVRREAALALGGVREAVLALIAALQGGEWAAAEALAASSAREAVPALIAALQDPRSAGPAARALGHLGDPAALPALERLARQPSTRQHPDDRDAPGCAREAIALIRRR